MADITASAMRQRDNACFVWSVCSLLNFRLIVLDYEFEVMFEARSSDLCCSGLGDDTLFSKCLSPARCTNG